MINKVRRYLPLLVVVFLAVAMSFAIHWRIHQLYSVSLMNSAMGFFFCLLSMFKLCDISGFVDGFQMYDIIAKRFRFYAYIFPFVELGLGLSFLAGIAPVIINAITLILMTISAFGVIRSIATGMDLRCACLGTVLNVPLSTVSIVENVAMSLMAALNIIRLVAT